MQQKRLVSIQDLSCFGKCSLTVALPVISSLGIETVVLPTAILSTHTGEFKNYTFLSLEDEFDKITNHWMSLGLKFDAIYIGYIGSVKMIDAVERFIDIFGKDTIVFVDPAMADNGHFYSGLGDVYAERISRLCKKSDIISPNITEALILSGLAPDVSPDSYTIDFLEHKLSKISPNVIITGIHTGKKVSTAYYSKTEGISDEIRFPCVKGNIYGSGDLFASSFIGCFVNGNTFSDSVRRAAAFVSDCIEKTLDEREKYWYGLKFEQSLPLLQNNL